MSDAAASYQEAQRLLALGRSREAVAPLHRAVGGAPRAGVIWRLLADIQLLSGDVAAARIAYDRMLAAVVPDERLRPSADALAEGRLEDAEGLLKDLLNAEPSNLPAAHLMAEALARRGELPAAEALLAHCLARAPQLHLVRQSLALLLHRQGRPGEALIELDRLLVREPRNNRCRVAKAAIMTELGDYAGAAEVTVALLEDFPDQPQAWMVHGHGLRTLGRIEATVAAYRRVLELDPGRAEAWWSLANLKAYRFTPADVAVIEARRARPDLDPDARSLLCFSLAKAREDEGDDAEAFAGYLEANTLQRTLRPYDAEATHAYAQRAKALFTADFFAARAGWGAPAADPIFIVGLPRSGSTLVEQILASHLQVEGTRELMDVQQMADWVAAQGRAPYPAPLAALPHEAIRQLGRDYLERTRPLRSLGRARFIDKAPWNWLHVGLIQLMLPNARIVDVRRHPLGCGLSAFKQHFAGGFDFAYDLADIGRYYADYVELMAHFDAVLPGRVVRVIYEDLVADTETQVRRLLDGLGLRFDPATLRFFENRRAVATPSSEQVRRPIFGEAVDHWQRFEPWLGPLKTALGPVLDAYPAAPASDS